MDVPVAYSQITGLTVAKTLGTIAANVSKAVIVPEAQAVRYRDDGTDPTASVGMTLAVGQYLTIEGPALLTIKFIEATPTAKLNVSFYKKRSYSAAKMEKKAKKNKSK